VFLEDGRVEMGTNPPIENTIRPLMLNRENAPFAGHDEGGRNWARIASLVETCRLNGGEPFAFLKAALKAIAIPRQSGQPVRLPAGPRLSNP
jgi:transposase